MPLVTLVSAKGSPGVTTLAAALAAASHRPDAPRTGAVLVELDPAGGDVEVLTGGRSGEPTLLFAARELRRDAGALDVASIAPEIRPGLRAVLAPARAQAAGPVIETTGAAVSTAVSRLTGWTVADAGRWDPQQPSARRLEGSALVAVVCRSTATSIAHARDLLAHLRDHRAAVVLVGDEPYGAEDVAGVVDVPVLGPVAWDQRGVAELWSGGASPRWQSRRALARTARGVLDGLADLVDAAPAQAPAATERDRRSLEATQ